MLLWTSARCHAQGEAARAWVPPPGERGYSSPPARRRLLQRRIGQVIPTRKDQPRQLDFDKAAYCERNKVEQLISRLKQYRRIATRYEKRAANYLAMVTLAITMLWLR